MNKNELTKIIKESLINYFYESLNTQKQKYGEDLVNKLLYLDPTKTYKYIEQICNYYKEGIDEKEIKEYIDKFDSILQRDKNNSENTLKNKDITLYKTFNELKKFVNNNFIVAKSQIKKDLYNKPYKIIENNIDKWNVYKPVSEEQSIVLGKNTAWCTAQKINNLFNKYFWRDDVDLYYIVAETKTAYDPKREENVPDKYQVVCFLNGEKEYRDIIDDLLTPEEFIKDTGIDPDIFKWDKHLNGTYIYKDENENIINVTYKDNKKEGWYKEYRPNKQLMFKCFYKNNKKEGEEVYINANDKQQVIQHFKNGKLEGEQIQYFPNGKDIQVKAYYKNNELEGDRINYYENGNIRYRIEYKDGKMNGRYEKYDKNGNPIIIKCYKDDKEIDCKGEQ